VTENALMNNIAETLLLLRKIRTLGVSLSIDDFGRSTNANIRACSVL
jgi:EAL domain-containing protein (putative c-di-GMP-specific phosphodiesterase class I)